MGSDEKAMAVAQACMREVLENLRTLSILAEDESSACLSCSQVKATVESDMKILSFAMKLLEQQIGG